MKKLLVSALFASVALSATAAFAQEQLYCGVLTIGKGGSFVSDGKFDAAIDDKFFEDGLLLSEDDGKCLCVRGEVQKVKLYDNDGDLAATAWEFTSISAKLKPMGSCNGEEYNSEPVVEVIK